MSATKEVEQPTEAVAAAQKPAKEKKQRTSKEKKPKAHKAASHPPYFQMIKEALLALKEKSGSSPYAIAKYMEEKHKAVLPVNFRKILGLQLKNSSARGKLIKIKASYKLSEAGKKDEGAMSKASRANAGKKPKQPKSGAKETKKKPEAEKKVGRPAKKAAATPKRKSARPKRKLLKSIKSPATKKANKAVA